LGAESKKRLAVARKERMPTETEGKRLATDVLDRHRERENILGEQERLPRAIRERPLEPARSGGVVHQLDRRAVGRLLGDRPAALPAVAVDRVWMPGKVAWQSMRGAAPAQRGVGDPVRERNQWVRGEVAHATARKRRGFGLAQDRAPIP